MEIPINPEITYVAKTNFRGKDQLFGIKRKDRRQHMYLLGKSGTGKSVLMENTHKRCHIFQSSGYRLPYWIQCA